MPHYLTRREAAEILRISLPTLHKLLKSGELRFVKIRGSVRIPEDAITELMGKGKVQGEQ